MEVTLTIPDKIVRLLTNGQEVSRALLESFAAEGCREGRLTTYEVAEILGFSTPMQVDEFLKKHGVYVEYTDAEIQAQRRSLEEVLPSFSE